MGLQKIVTQDDFDKNIKESKNISVLYCAATWCGPCKIMSPEMESLDKEFHDEKSEINVFKLDIGEGEEVAKNLDLMAVPSLIIFKNGKEINRFVGYHPKDKLKVEINATVNQ